MKYIKALSLSAALLCTIIGGTSASTIKKPLPTAMAEIINTSGEKIGSAHFTQGKNGVLVHIKVSKLTPGAHGIHLHSTGQCDKSTGFKSAKGHVGLVKDGHGILNAMGPEAGDIPNIFVGENGVGEMEVHATMVSLVDGEYNLFDADGSAVVIHADADDHFSQPIGNSGGRVACGVIVPIKQSIN
ncbi:MAG: superoxide dismutase family protein [Rhizobiaceae bacterium]|nr:superoxide dismutase family protein [Rhizobiaceae bacterium]